VPFTKPSTSRARRGPKLVLALFQLATLPNSLAAQGLPLVPPNEGSSSIRSHPSSREQGAPGRAVHPQPRLLRSPRGTGRVKLRRKVGRVRARARASRVALVLDPVQQQLLAQVGGRMAAPLCLGRPRWMPWPSLRSSSKGPIYTRVSSRSFQAPRTSRLPIRTLKPVQIQP